ncbi:unnamed protein product [Prunus armeniaca]
MQKTSLPIPTSLPMATRLPNGTLLKGQSSSCQGRTCTENKVFKKDVERYLFYILVWSEITLTADWSSRKSPFLPIGCSEIALVAVSSPRKSSRQSSRFTHKCKVNFSSGATPIYRARVHNGTPRKTKRRINAPIRMSEHATCRSSCGRLDSTQGTEDEASICPITPLTSDPLSPRTTASE